MSYWSERKSLFLEGKSDDEIQQITGKSESAVRHARERLVAAGVLKKETSDLSTFKAGIDKAKQDIIRKAEIRQLTTLRNEQAQFDLLRDAIVAGMPRLASFESTEPFLIYDNEQEWDEEVANLVISDVHVGKLVEPSVVGDEYGYNVEQFDAMAEAIFNSVGEITTIHRNSYPVRKLNIFLLGDLVDHSDMRPGQKLRVDLTVGQQVLTLVKTFVPLLAGAAQKFDTVNVIGVGGNHGRVGKPGENLPVDNFDVIAMEMMAIALQNYTNIIFNVSHRPYAVVELIPGFVAHLSHGEKVGRGAGGFSGIPTDATARSGAKDNGLHGRLFDLVVFGHFHNPQWLNINGTPTVINGAWDGGDDFSVNELKMASLPSQWFFGLHPRRGVTWRYEIQPRGGRRRDAVAPIVLG